MLRERLIKPELLDHADPAEARVNLRDLVRINERFGGHGVLRKLLAKVVQPQQSFSLLDVGAASGDTAKLIRQTYPNAVTTSLDLNRVNVDAANHPKLIADAFQLPFASNSFDFVLASLFLHHFTNEQVTLLLRNFHDVAREAVLVNDLERHILSYCFLPMTKAFFGWNRITLHDGPVSVRAAFRADELRALGNGAGIEKFEVEVHRPAFRLSAVGRK